MRKVLTSTHLRELKNVEQSTETQVIQEQGLSRKASVSRRGYQGLLRTIGSTGLGRGASGNGGGTKLEEPEPEEPEVAPESRHRRVISEGKHCRSTIHATALRLTSFIAGADRTVGTHKKPWHVHD